MQQVADNQSRKPNEERYEGAPKALAVLGKSYAYSLAGKLIGFGAGVIASFVTTKTPGTFTKRAEEFLKPLGITHPQWLMAIGTGFAGGWVGHWIGLAVGAKRALKDAGRGEQQFQRIKAERDSYANQKTELENNVVTLQQELETHKREQHGALVPSETPTPKYTGDMDSLAEKGGYTAAREAEKEAAAQEAPVLH